MIDVFGACIWQSQAFDIITVGVYRDDRDKVESYFEIGNEESAAIDDVGDRAYWNPDIGNFEALWEDYAISISIYAGELSKDQQLEASKELVRLMIDRLE
jgi:hypothetical protein